MRRPDLNTVVITQGAAGTTELVPAVTAQRIVVESVALVMDAAGSATFKSGANAITGAMPLGANGGVVLPSTGQGGEWFKTAEGEALNLVTVTGKAFGCLTYRIEDT